LSDGSVGSGARVDGISRRSSSTDATAVELDLEEGEQEGGKLSVLLDFGPASRANKRPRTGDIGNASFVYDPELVRTAVFPPPVAIPVTTPPTRKKRKLDTGASSPVEAAEPTPKMRAVILYNDTTTYTLEPNDASSSSSRRTYTLRSSSPPNTHPTDISSSKAPLLTETVLATVLDEADIVFSNAGFRYRVKTLDDDNDDDEDTMMNDTDIGVGDMSDVRRVLRWRYAVDPEIVRKTAAATSKSAAKNSPSSARLGR
jgi:hypothetical protein